MESRGRGRGSRSYSAGMSLNTMLSDKRGPIRTVEEQFPRAHSNRTLSDIIRDESGGTTHYYTGKKSWRHFKDKLRRHRGAAWTSTFSTPASDIPINNRSMNRRPSGGFPSDMAHPVDISAVPDVDPELMSNPRNRPSLQRNTSRAMKRASDKPEHAHALGMRRLQREDNSEDDKDDYEEEECESGEGESGCEGEDEEATSAGKQQPVRMSLMSLLAETDREMGLDGSSYMLDEDDEDEDEDEDDNGDAGEYNNCCVCMVRHKGAAFVPCGHSFCRLCSRELWAQRGNCPLCNNYILEILDIF